MSRFPMHNLIESNTVEEEEEEEEGREEEGERTWIRE
jgi:hypothetical protein